MSPQPGKAPLRGVLAALGGYTAWGLLPVFWHLLADVDARELIAHRLFWTMLFTLPLLWIRGGWPAARHALSSFRSLGLNLTSAILLACNWLVYVWAINHGHVIESSLGYFLVPLVNVALGWSVLHERLRRTQWLAIALATAGVSMQLIRLGRLPWVALLLAGTFGVYGLLRKRSPLGPLTGLTVETVLLAPWAAIFLLVGTATGAGALGHAPAATRGLVLCTGIITAVPLLLFAYGARRLQLVTLGLLQYVAPTAQFGLGLWFFHEPFASTELESFALIWAGLGLYTADSIWRQRRAGELTVALPSTAES